LIACLSIVFFFPGGIYLSVRHLLNPLMFPGSVAHLHDIPLLIVAGRYLYSLQV